jgi:hypothetical protein
MMPEDQPAQASQSRLKRATLTLPQRGAAVRASLAPAQPPPPLGCLGYSTLVSVYPEVSERETTRYT